MTASLANVIHHSEAATSPPPNPPVPPPPFSLILHRFLGIKANAQLEETHLIFLAEACISPVSPHQHLHVKHCSF